MYFLNYKESVCAIRQYAFMAFASKLCAARAPQVFTNMEQDTGGKKGMYMNLLHPLSRFEQRSFSSSVSCSKELT